MDGRQFEQKESPAAATAGQSTNKSVKTDTFILDYLKKIVNCFFGALLLLAVLAAFWLFCSLLEWLADVAPVLTGFTLFGVLMFIISHELKER